ncbi:hypothetical protein [Nocardia sp. NPDC005825]|uniref:sulfotransferase-like domain-containing protein n=1 Tax=unclassified Nocardia TaxID=2637762 RepID=UPI0033CB285E
MWSGPRFMSTALLRSWESRADTATADEPFYGYFLAATGADRPGRDDALASMPQQWSEVVRWLEGPIPDGKAIWYQKHHSLHLVGEMPWQWISGMTNCFLIRDPRLVIKSYSRIRPEFTADDLGYKQLVEVFDFVRSTAITPIVVDASDLRRSPGPQLETLCAAVGVPFDPAMLRWAPGRRSSDPPLGDPWYQNVQQTTGFAGTDDPVPAVPRQYWKVLELCTNHYDYLSMYRLGATR